MRNNMTRRAWLQSSTAALACLALPEYALGAAAEKNGASRVWMTKEISPEALVRIYEALGRPATGKAAVKISTGEPGGRNFLSPALIKGLVRRVNGTIVECNTAYGGKRSRTEDHLRAAKEHGFSDIARVDIMDAEGEFTIPVKDRKHLEYDIVGNHLKNYDFMINLAHFKGHAMGGFGGVIKNQSIGVASASGKAYIHSAGKTRDVAAVWNNLAAQDDFLESMAASAQAVADYFGDRILYINVMNKLSIDCDCDAHPHDPEMKDIGILASLDPVALDQACLDLVYAVKPSAGDNSKPLIERIETHVFNQQVKARELMEKYGTRMESWGPFAEGRNGFFTNPVLKDIGEKYGKTPAQTALRFLIQRGVIVIPKTTHRERMEENFNVFDFELSQEDMGAIARLDRGESLFLCHQDPESVLYLINYGK